LANLLELALRCGWGNPPQRFVRIGIMRDAFLDAGIHCVFSAEGGHWHRQRQVVMQAVDIDHAAQVLRSAGPGRRAAARRWQKAAHNGALVDVPGALKRFMVDITSGLALGTDLDSWEDQGDVIQHYLDEIFPVMARRTLATFRYWRWLRWAGNRQADVAMERLMDAVPCSRAHRSTSDAIELAGGHGVGQRRRSRTWAGVLSPCLLARLRESGNCMRG
jgi:hypothetical protein